MLLLDTHVVIWWLEGRELSTEVRDRISAPSTPVHASMVNHWEIAIKEALGKLRAPASYVTTLDEESVPTLPVTLPHVDALRALPLLHRDPFDRMLVAQAQVERLTLVTRDKRLRDYDIDVLDA